MLERIINWIASKSGNDNERDIKESLAFGLALGLIVGLAFGLGLGLGTLGFGLGLGLGLALGLAAGLAFVLAAGLAAGLAFVLAAGLAAGLANLITTTAFIPKEWLAIIIIIVVIAEIIFWCFDKSKAKKGQSILAFTAKRKLFAFTEAFYWVINGLGALGLILGGSKITQPIVAFFALYGLSILEVIGIGALVIGGIMAYIYLNSLKFRVKKR